MEPERLEYPLTRDSVIVEIGGYLGEFAEAAIQKFNCNLVIFEPLPRFYGELRRLESDKVRVFNYGIGDRDRREKISVRNDSSSLYRESTDGQYEEVEIRELGRAMYEVDLDRIDLLSCNCEGGEYEILPYAISNGLIGTIKDAMIQFHSFVPDAGRKRDDIRKSLRRTHVETACTPFVWESWRRK